MSFDREKLYNLLPAIYRIRDEERGKPPTFGPLQALLSVIADEIAVLEEDLAQLYDDQFIETCAEWVVPYIGDLVGDRTPHSVTAKIRTSRAEVANTIAYRRRKGTATMLEQLARDVTGWDARVVEFFQLLATTQYLNHLRPNHNSWVSLRGGKLLERLNTGFDSMPHTLDVHRIESRRGRYNIPNIGIFLWRLQAYPLIKGTPFPVQLGLHYTFNPLGMDASLFNPPQTEDEITHLAEPINVPEPLNRRLLYEDLESLRQGLTNLVSQSPAEGTEAEEKLRQQSVYFGRKPILEVFLGGNDNPIPPEEIVICDLSNWQLPPASKDYTPKPTPTDLNSSVKTFPIQVAIDPVLGRLAFPSVQAQPVVVSYSYGFSYDLGGGPYERSEAEQEANYTVSTVNDLANVLADLSNEESQVAIEIDNNTTLNSDFTVTPNGEQQVTIQGRNGMRPVIQGSFTINAATDAKVILDGLLISQNIQVKGTAKMTLVLRHCTLAPWLELQKGKPKPPTSPSIVWTDDNSDGFLRLDRTISGAIAVAPHVEVAAYDSIIDALEDSRFALAANLDGSKTAGKTQVIRTTVIGRIFVREIALAENSIFTGKVTVKRRQVGCIRFCYLPTNSLVPRRYRCQPQNNSHWERIYPQFTSRHYGDPGYCQLSQQCVIEIRQGADDEAEMGAFHNLYQPQRETNLRLYLDRYLRFGLEAGIFYAT